MAGPTLKEYVIKITADAKEAQRELDSLAKTSSKISLDEALDKKMTDSLESVTGAIGKVVSEIKELQGAFKDTGLKTFGQDFKSLANDLNKTIGEMKSSFDGFKDTYSAFSDSSGKSGLTQVFNDFTQQMQNMVDSYQQIMEIISGISSGKINANVFQQVTNSTAQGIEEGNQRIENAKERLRNTMDELSKLYKFDIKNAQGKKETRGITYSIDNPGMTDRTELERYEGTLLRTKQLIQEISGVLSASDISDVLSEYGLSEKSIQRSLTNITDQIKEEYSSKKREIKELAGAEQQEPIEIRLKVTLDPDSVNESGVNKIVSEIRQNLQDKVQSQIQSNPIKIPLAFSSAIKEDATDEEVEKTLNTNESGAKQGLVKAIKLQVQTDRDALQKQIEEAIKDINHMLQGEGEEVPRIKVKVEADLNKQSIEKAAYDITDKIEDHNEELGRDAVPLSSKNNSLINIGDTGNLATESTLQAILSTISGLEINGIKLSSGSSSKNNIDLSDEAIDNSDVALKEYEKQLRYRNRSYKLNEEKADQYNTTEMLLSKSRYGLQMGEQLKKLRTVIKGDNKDIDELKDLDIYKAQYIDDDGNIRARFGEGTLLVDWQKKLEATFKMYKAELKDKLDAETVYDENGNITKEGVRTYYERIRASKNKIKYNDDEIFEWQKVILDANEEARQRELKETSNRYKSLINSERAKTMQGMNPELTMDEAIKKIINDDWNAKNQQVLSATQMNDTLKEVYDSIKSRAVSDAKTAVLKDTDLLMRTGVSGLAYYLPLERQIQLSEKSRQTYKNSLALNHVEIDDKTGRVIANALTAVNEQQGSKEVSKILDSIAQEQAIKLRDSEQVRFSAKKDLDNLREFIGLRTKQTGQPDEFTEADEQRLETLRRTLSSRTVQALATGAEKEAFENANQIIATLEKKAEQNKGKLSDIDQASLNAAQDVLNNTREATVDEVFRYAQAAEPQQAQVYIAASKRSRNIRKWTRNAAEQIANENEYLRPVVTGGVEGHNKRQRELKANTAELREFYSMMTQRADNGTYDTSSLTNAEKERYNWLKKRNNLLNTQEALYQRMQESVSDISEKEQQTVDNSEKSNKAKVTGLHLTQETSEAYGKVLTTSDQDLSKKSSKELAEMAKAARSAETEMSDYLSSTEGQNVEERAKMMVAEQIDNFRKQITNIDKEIEKAKKEGASDRQLNRLQNRRSDIVQSIEQLTGTSEQDAEVARKIAELTIQRKKVDENLRVAKENGESETNINELSNQSKDLQKQIYQLSSSRSKTRSSKKIDVDKNIENIASARIAEIDEEIASLGNGETNKELSIKNIPLIKSSMEDITERISHIREKTQTEVDDLTTRISNFDQQIADSESKGDTAKAEWGKENRSKLQARLEKIQEPIKNMEKQYQDLQSKLNDIIRNADPEELSQFNNLVEELSLMKQIRSEAQSSLLEMSRQVQEGTVQDTSIRQARERSIAGNLRNERTGLEGAKAAAASRAEQLEALAQQRAEEEQAAEEQERIRQEEARVEAERTKRISKMSREKLESEYDTQIDDLKKLKEAKVAEQDKLASRVIDGSETHATNIDIQNLNQQIEAAKNSLEIQAENANSLESLFGNDEQINELMSAITKREANIQHLTEEINSEQLRVSLSKETINKYQGKEKLKPQQKEELEDAQQAFDDSSVKVEDLKERRQSQVNAISQLKSDVQKRKDEILQTLLSNYEQDIEAIQQEFIDAVNNNADENTILNLRQRLLSKFDTYRQYGGKKSFSSTRTTNTKLRETDPMLEKQASDIEKVLKTQPKYFNNHPEKGELWHRLNSNVVERTGFIGDKSALQYARDYVPDSLNALYEQRKVLMDKLKAQEGQINTQDNNSDQIASKIAEEINTLDQQIATLEQQKIQDVTRQLMLKANTTKSEKSARKLVNDAFNLQKEQIENSPEYKNAQARRKQISEELVSWRSKPDGKGKSDAIASLTSQLQEVDALINSVTEIEEERSRVLEQVKQKFGGDKDVIIGEPKEKPQIGMSGDAQRAKKAAELAAEAAAKKAMETIEQEEFAEQIRQTEKYKFKEDTNPWKAARFANMTEDEAIISEQIRRLSGKAYVGKASDDEQQLLDELRVKAIGMGLSLDEKGHIRSKVSYQDFLQNPNNYTLPTITTEKARAAGLSTVGTVSATVQQVTVSDPINVANVGQVAQVASVNLGTIESLLSSIASKIGAEVPSGIKTGTKGKVPNAVKNDLSQKELNKIIGNKGLSQSERDAALRVGLSRSWLGLGKTNDEQMFLVKRKNKSLFDEDLTNEWIDKLGVTPSQKSVKKSSSTPKAKTRKQELNDILRTSTDQEEIDKALLEGLKIWGLGKNEDTGKLFFAKKGGKKFNAQVTIDELKRLTETGNINEDDQNTIMSVIQSITEMVKKNAEKINEMERKVSEAEGNQTEESGETNKTKQKTQKVSVGAQREYKPYTAEDFAANKGLAEHVLRYGKPNAKNAQDAEFWKQSQAAAQEYLGTLKQVKDEQKAKTSSEQTAESEHNEAEAHSENANAMSEEAKEAERLAEVKRKATEKAGSYDDPKAIQKQINRRESLLKRSDLHDDTRERNEAELEAFKNRLAEVKPDAATKENTQELHENAGAAREATQAHEGLNNAINAGGTASNATDENTQDLHENAEAAHEAADAQEDLGNKMEQTAAKVKGFQNIDEAVARIKELNPDFEEGQHRQWRSFNNGNGFRYADENVDYTYRYTKKNGGVLQETPQVVNELKALEDFEKRYDRITSMVQTRDFMDLDSRMFTGLKSDRIKEAQSILEDLSNASKVGFAEFDPSEIESFSSQLEHAYDIIRQFRNQKVGEEVIVGQTSGGLVTARADLEAYINSLQNSTVSVQKFGNSNTELTYTLRTADDMIETHTVSINQYGQMIDKLSQSSKYISPLQQAFSGLGAKVKELFTYFTASASIYRVFNTFRQGVSVVKELDTTLTEMRKVSDESLQSLKNYQLESFNIADRVGTTAKQIQQSTADWMRLGEELPQAKKSAEYSTLLLNVSEFQNIDAATESLVAMSQAYKDIDKLDIIDKLNNIGNNYSISTSDLAQSLQKSAGALTTAHNTIDEAIALTVAGNQVLQSPDIVGQSLKTIALRLTGTSIEDMQEAGEEIDGLISTQSKLQKTIMDITKVPSNGYKGFNILDDNGNYKTTYEMLKGIAEVWQEIGEEDKKMGTNRQSLLLETIAGKTRAAAASSILDNFKVLQDVYESSLNSEGSAQQELDKYLDSVDGKMQQLQNRMQELAAISLDSEFLKGLIDSGTKAIEIVTTLAKHLGSIQMIIGGLSGIFLQKNGLGKSRRENALYTEHNNNAIMLLVQVIL